MIATKKKKINIKLLSSTPPVVVGTGLIVLDIIVEGNDTIQLHVGGSCGNVLSILAALGWKSWPVGRLGEDRNGELITEEIKNLGMHSEYLTQETNIQTPVILEKVRPGGVPTRTHSYSLRCPNCGTFFPRFRPIRKETAAQVSNSLKRASVFYFDRTSPGALSLANYYRQHGSLIVFEPSSVGDGRLFKQALQSAHILKYSRERVTDIAETVGEFQVPLEIETLGPDGLRYKHIPINNDCKKSNWVQLPACKVSNLVDEAGSGDWCTAGLIYLLGRNGASSFLRASESSLREAIMIGQSLASVNCSYIGARGVMSFVPIKELIDLATRVANGHCLEAKNRAAVSIQSLDVLGKVCPQCTTERSD
ncbi:MAG: PfkB family carbohydrate kinase [Dehalococcoidales bacterium]|nr:PfkB family carbohydrate kinase [Dehalococcoidales bacterium]